MPIYRSTGQLVDAIEPENVAVANEYLQSDPMAQYLEGSLAEKVESIEWRLEENGLDYVVTAFALRALTKAELKELADWTSGQNSDGLGEGFEQQDWAWVGGTYNSYGDEVESGHMASFDWETNDSAFTRVV